MTRTDITDTEIGNYFRRYVDIIPENVGIFDALRSSLNATTLAWSAIPPSLHDWAYAPEKWTVKQALQHLIDTERIFAYRALCFARNDKTELPGFDQDLYADEATAKDKQLDVMLKDLSILRMNTIALYESMTSKELCRIGSASGNPMSARAAFFIICGHCHWHVKVLEERYQKPATSE